MTEGSHKSFTKIDKDNEIVDSMAAPARLLAMKGSVKYKRIFSQVLGVMLIANLSLPLLFFPLPQPSNDNGTASTPGSTLETSLVNVSINEFNKRHANTSAIPLQNYTHHIFFNIYINVDTNNAFFRSFKIIDEQLRQLSENKDDVRYQIFYNLLGGKRYRHYIGNNGDGDLCHKYPNLDCHLLKHYKKGGEEITLHDLYQYCQSHPTHRATYIHNKGSLRFSSGNIKNRRRATIGAASTHCLNMPLSNEYPCNICGVKFQYVPFMLFQANMWTAECSYINTLIPPKEYESKRREVFERLWQDHACLNHPPDSAMEETNWAWNLSDALFLRNVGLGRYALERWTLNHPTMIPCDLIAGAVRDIDRPEVIPRLGRAEAMGKMITKKSKARQSWLMQQEYEQLYPNYTVNNILLKDQAFPRARPCWDEE